MVEMTLTETERYLGVSAAWMDKIWQAFGRVVPGLRGTKRYFSEKDVKLLETAIVLRRCGLSLKELAEYYKIYVKEDVWDVKKFISDNPIVRRRISVELERLNRILSSLLEFQKENL